MDCYFCIVDLPGKMGADVCVLVARDDSAAMKAMAEQAARWIGFETIFLYYGERFIGSLVHDSKEYSTGARADTGAIWSHRVPELRDFQQPRPAQMLSRSARKTG